MARCSTCGNEYDKCIEVVAGDTRHVFDCFECAIYLLAPTCAHCGCRIIGHGVETGDSDEAVYCCAHCARHASSEAVAAGPRVTGFNPRES